MVDTKRRKSISVGYIAALMVVGVETFMLLRLSSNYMVQASQLAQASTDLKIEKATTQGLVSLYEIRLQRLQDDYAEREEGLEKVKRCNNVDF